MKALKALALSLALAVITLTGTANAGIPWLTSTHSINVQSGSGALTCTSFTTSDVCYAIATGNITGVTLSGGAAAGNYVFIANQDGTGSRTWVLPTNMVMPDGSAVPAPASAANAYTVYVLQKVGTNYQVQGAYDNLVITPNNLIMANGSQASAIACDFSLASICTATATGAATLTIYHPVKGQSGKVELTQDATGRAITISPVPVAPNGLTLAAGDVFAETASATTVADFYWDGTSEIAQYSSVATGICAGQQALSSGTPSTATVSNKCFTGATNGVICTDCSGSGAGATIRCVPSAGSLAITGQNTVTDTVCWARIF